MVKFSIITTTYNHQDFIWYTIQSVLNQNIFDRELLIGDDSPGGETWKVIGTYTKKYPDKIKARHHTPNKWIVDNMNFLISKIANDSQYVAFLEGDDMRDQDYLQRKLDIFTKYPEVQLIYNNLDFIDSKNKILQKDIFSFRRIKTYQNCTICPNDYISANVWPIISRSTSMVHRNIVDKYKINSLHPENKAYSVSDYDFYFQVAKDHQVYYINEPLTLYRRHQTNLSWINPNVLDEVWALIQKYHEQKLISDKIYYKKMSHNNLVQSLIYLENGQKNKSFQHWKDSLKYHRSSYIVMRLWALFLLCLPLARSKWILSKLIKRG